MSRHITEGHYAATRKVQPGMKPDNTPDDNDRIEIGPTQLAYDEWAAAGLECPDLPAMRAHRHRRIVEDVNRRGLAGVLLTLASGEVHARTGVTLQIAPGLAELKLLCAVTVAGALAGLVPAWNAYRTEPARHLSSGL